MKHFNNINVMIAVIAGAICCLVYSRSLTCDFVDLDDYLYVVDNLFIRQLDLNLLSNAFALPLNLWIPLTYISFAVDYHIWGLNPFGFHLTNMILHAINVGLVVLIADALLKKRFENGEPWDGLAQLYPFLLLISGLYFGLHPLRVESVAWVTERKDVLNGVFTFSSILFYLHYVEFKDSGGGKSSILRSYLISVILFALSVMAKPSSVVIPLSLLIVDYFPLYRGQKNSRLRLILEKLPYVVISMLVSGITLNAGSQKQTLVSYDYIPILERATISGNALFEYCRLFVYPAGISPYFQIPNELPMTFVVKSVVIAVILVASVACFKRWPLLSAPWLLFLIPFITVLAFFQNGSQMFAARFTYLPSLVPSVMVSVVTAAICNKLLGLCSYKYIQRFVVTLAAVLFVFYAGMTLKLIAVWDSTETLWTRVIEIKPIGMAYKSRGIYYLEHGKYDAAIADFTAAIGDEEIMQYVFFYNFFAFRGFAFEMTGRYEEAIKDFTEAINGFPHPDYYLHRARALTMIGRNKDAEGDFFRAGQTSGRLSWLTD
jgi:hypothetical protein